MENCPMSFMWNHSLRGCEDMKGTDDGLSCFADTDLRLNSRNDLNVAHKQNGDAGKRKCKSDVEMLDLENGVSLALELGYSGTSCSKTKYVVLDSGLSSKKDVDGFKPHICLDFNQNKDFRGSSLTVVTPQNEMAKVDLELSLSTVAAESDLTSITLNSSPTQYGKQTLALSSIEQLVDEGSTSSKWKRGPFVALIDSLVVNASTPLEGTGSYVNQVGASSHPPEVSVQSAKIDDNDASQSKERRKTSIKPCQFPSCQKGARGASSYCISHGGGRRCQRLGCQKGAEGKTPFCKAHGGGRRCEHLECTKSAEGRTNLCIAHGGGRRCTFPGGCTHGARGKSGLCIRHGGGKRCKMENCTKSAEGLAGLCIAHGGGRRCQHPQCTKGAQGSTKFCKAHGGGKRCTFLGCTKGAEGSTLFCKGHGGGKRCSYQDKDGVCSKSVHGGTLYCVSHGGGKRCGVSGCTKSARGRTDFCVRHGGGKRCQFEGCGKSAQGSTDFCKGHGGGKRCLWGQPDSTFGGDSANPCDKIARGKIGLCSAHAAQVQDKRVHGDGTVGLKMKGTAIESLVEVSNNVPGEGSSTLWNEFNFGAYGQGCDTQMNLPDDKHLVGGPKEPNSSEPASLPEGRVHGGGLLAMLKGW